MVGLRGSVTCYRCTGGRVDLRRAVSPQHLPCDVWSLMRKLLMYLYYPLNYQIHGTLSPHSHGPCISLILCSTCPRRATYIVEMDPGGGVAGLLGQGGLDFMMGASYEHGYFRDAKDHISIS